MSQRTADNSEPNIFKSTFKVMDDVGMQPYSCEVKKSLTNWLRYYLPRMVVAELCCEAVYRYSFFYYNWNQLSVRQLPKLIFILIVIKCFSSYLANFYYYPMHLRDLYWSVENMNIDYGSKKRRHRLILEDVKRKIDVVMKYVPPIVYTGMFVLGPAEFMTLRFDDALSHGVYFVHDFKSSPAREISLFICAVIWGTSFSLFVTYNLAWASLLINIKLQFEFLRNNLLHIHKDSRKHIKTAKRRSEAASRDCTSVKLGVRQVDGSELKDEINLELQTRLVECIKHHQALLRILRDFQNLNSFNFNFGIILFISAVSLGVSYITAASSFDAVTSTVLTLLCLGASAFGSYCYFFHELTLQCALVREAVYACEWFDATESFKRSMRIMMSMANQPFVMKAEDCVAYNLETFRAVLKSIHGYYAVISKLMKTRG